MHDSYLKYRPCVFVALPPRSAFLLLFIAAVLVCSRRRLREKPALALLVHMLVLVPYSPPSLWALWALWACCRLPTTNAHVGRTYLSTPYFPR